MKILKEIILPRRPPKNPVPSLSDGGDCGACVLAGILQCSIEEAYKFHCSGEYLGGKPIPQVSAFSIYSMKRTLESLYDDCGISTINGSPVKLKHAITDIPIWPFCGPMETSLAFGFRSVEQWCWKDYARAMLDGGYYGVAQVFDQGYPQCPDLKHYGQTNHWVMICGWRYTEDDGGGSYSEWILIGNSSNAVKENEQWLELGHFLKHWGGFGALWAKPL